MFKKSSVTVVEFIIVLAIISVLATIGLTGWQAQIEKEAAYNAKSTLQMLWQAETNYFVWKNRYTNDLGGLEIDNPNNTDKFYQYTIEEATATTLLIKATRIGKSAGFKIDQDGAIASFT
jgi:Tfp pilus assembly protein PilE